jgi:hypothetical protein
MKKVLSLFMVLLLAISLFACGRIVDGLLIYDSPIYSYIITRGGS